MLASVGKVSSWTNNNWQCVLRNVDSVIAKKIAESADALAYKTYTGDDRNEAHSVLRERAYKPSRIRKAYSCDNSAFVVLSCLCAGIDVLEYSGEAMTEDKTKNTFPSIGFKRITDIKYLKSAKMLKKGDILVKSGDCAIVI